MQQPEIELINDEALHDKIDENQKVYLIINALDVERWAFIPLSADSLEIPEVKDLPQLLNEHDRYIKIHWLWEDTEWNTYYRQGPCLIELEKDSPLIDYYRDVLAVENFGILVQASASTEDLIEHLKSVLRVTIEGKGLVYFKLHNADTLASYIDVLEENKLRQLLGPINTMIWCQNTGKKSQWLHFSEEANYEHHPKALGWFTFSQEDIEGLDQDALLFYRKSIINDALYYREKGYFERQPTMSLQNSTESGLREKIYQLLEEAKQYGVTDKKLAKRWVELHLYYESFINNTEIQTLLKDTSQHQNKRIKRVNYLIDQTLENDKKGETA